MTLFSLKNKEKGMRCFILGNGPSINNYDLSHLKGEIVIGMNASTLLEKKYGFFQKYYTVSDARFLSHPQKRTYACSELCPKTIRIIRRELAEVDDKKLKNKTCYVKSLGRDGFSPNIHNGFYFGCTTAMLALQLAYTLGCIEIYMLGIDLNYNSSQPRFYKEEKIQDHDLFCSVQIWNIANAYNFILNQKKRLYICSEKSLLRPYVDYAEYNSLFYKG